MAKRLSAAVVAASFVATLCAQTPPAAVPAFDVASIKPNHSGELEYSSIVQPGGRFVSTNISLRMLMKIAYGVHDDQIAAGPSWIDTDRWDINAKAEGYTNAAAFLDAARRMVRPLLADRFRLVLRHEPRELPVYALVVAKPNGGFGPNFRRNEHDDCTGPPALPMQPAQGTTEPAIKLGCGVGVFRPGHLAARAMTLRELIVTLTRFTDRVVVDRTGLTGKFDWDIQWVPDDLRVDNVRPPDGPSIFAAFLDQAGLKLERSRGEVDVLVVEHVERPESD
jgi:uncharacterized protein (TIGR03435 family)